MPVPKILIQLDTDPLPSSFDSVVAADSGVETLLRYGSVRPENVTPLVHGAVFTRGGDDLRHTAIFVGGSDVHAAEAVLAKVASTFFGPVRVSVMFDANGCNTTASSAVLSAMRHLPLGGATATVLGGTGPVGLRVSRLLSGAGCAVRLASRHLDRAQEAVRSMGAGIAPSLITAVAANDADSTGEALEGSQMVFACGAAGARLLDQSVLDGNTTVRVAVDLNAVPPAGIEGVEVTDRGREVGSRLLYGAVGVGGLKMKIHKAAIAALFTNNDRMLDLDEIFAIGREIT